LWQHKKNNKRIALSIVRETIGLVRDPAYIRVFLDLGLPLKNLLKQLNKEQKSIPLIRNVLNAYRYETIPAFQHTDYSELTYRELEIMELVSKGFLNKEIADILSLSETTIKTYLYRLYKKLGVNNRLSAIQKLHKLQPE
jgi:LuxR family maltose regulon positive regulatory protein